MGGGRLRYTDPPPSDRLTEGRAPEQGTLGLSVALVDEIDAEAEALLRAAWVQNR